MYDVAGEKRPIFLESDAFSYNLDDPSIRKRPIQKKIGRFSPATPYIRSVRLLINQTVFTEPRRPYISTFSFSRGLRIRGLFGLSVFSFHVYWV
jgi:hypothetical protein